MSERERRERGCGGWMGEKDTQIDRQTATCTCACINTDGLVLGVYMHMCVFVRI